MTLSLIIPRLSFSTEHGGFIFTEIPTFLRI